MGYSIKDMENAARSVNQRLEQRSQERGEALANHVLQRTAQGRGLWFIVLWPAWLLICVFSGVFFANLLDQFGIGPPLSWAGMLGGILLARAWYLSDFTINHPFLGSVFGYFGTAIAAMVLARTFGISL